MPPIFCQTTQLLIIQLLLLLERTPRSKEPPRLTFPMAMHTMNAVIAVLSGSKNGEHNHS